MIADAELDKSLIILNVIWGAMILAVLIYMFGVPPFLDKAYRFSLSADAIGALRVALYSASCGVIIAARILPKHLFSGRATSKQNTTISAHPAIQSYASAMILALALSEVIAIFGLVLFFIARDTASLYLLGTISVLSMLLHRPVRQDVINAVSDHEMIARKITTSL